MRSATTTTGIHRLRFLDGVRGVAALYVVISHIWDTAFATGAARRGHLRDLTVMLGFGRFAVSVFILVSGYSIGLAVWKGNLRWPGGTRRYIVRRTMRIWPPYAVAVLISSAVALTLLHTGDGPFYQPASHIRPWGVISNLALLQDVHWAGPAGSPAFWSIPVEFHIYFFFLLVLVCMRRRFNAWLGFVFALILLTAGSIHFADNPVLGEIAGLSPSLYALFLLGFMAGRVAVAPDRFSWREWNRVLLAVFLLGILLVFLDHREWTALSPLNDCIVGAPAAWVLSAVTAGRLAVLRRALESRIAVWLGDSSYSLYLIHAVVIELVWKFLVTRASPGVGTRLLLELAIGVPASVLVSRAFYLAFERPFMRARDRRAAPGLAMADALIVAPPGSSG